MTLLLIGLAAVTRHPILPVSRFKAYTSPVWLPTMSQSPTSAGLLRTSLSSGKAKLHFNVRELTFCTVIPLCAVVLKPVPSGLPPHPEQSYKLLPSSNENFT